MQVAATRLPEPNINPSRPFVGVQGPIRVVTAVLVLRKNKPQLIIRGRSIRNDADPSRAVRRQRSGYLVQPNDRATLVGHLKFQLSFSDRTIDVDLEHVRSLEV